MIVVALSLALSERTLFRKGKRGARSVRKHWSPVRKVYEPVRDFDVTGYDRTLGDNPTADLSYAVTEAEVLSHASGNVAKGLLPRLCYWELVERSIS